MLRAWCCLPVLALIPPAAQAAEVMNAPVATTETQIQLLSGTEPGRRGAVGFPLYRRTSQRGMDEDPGAVVLGTAGLRRLFSVPGAAGILTTIPQIPKEQGRYRTDFAVPAAWRGRDVRLVFDGVMTDAEVRVNGQPAGSVLRQVAAGSITTSRRW